ncbi:MAG TPA: polysaccharide biosynthesis protein [Bacillota bacterium]|nr:polysaccharide biosynthesis protein [Bacillota bacterium]
MKQTGSVLKGTVVLSTAALCVKILGAVYRIYLSRLIGTEGIGLYQMAYPVYLIFLSLSTAGVPIAISKIVAEKVSAGDWAGIQNTFKAAFVLLFGLGLICSAGMVLSASWVSANLLADYRAVYSIWALAPSIFLMSLTAVFRGYFQGWLEMQPSAWSQIFEQIIRVVAALVLAGLLLKRGVERAAAGAAFGATAGGAAALFYLVVHYWSRKRTAVTLTAKGPTTRESLGKTIHTLIRFALPISIAVVLTPLLQALDSVVVPRRLQEIGYSVTQATSMLGVLGNSWAVVHLPLIVTTAISANLVPAIAGIRREHHYSSLELQIANGIRMALIYLVPVFVMMSLCGETIYRIIYGQQGIGLLSWFAPAVLFLGVEQVTAGVIQGLGKPKWPLYSFVVGSVFKLIITVIMTGWPGLNLAGAALGTVCGSGLTTVINLAVIHRLSFVKNQTLLPVILAGTGMYGLGCSVQHLMQCHYLLEFVGIGLAGCLGYLVILVCLGGISSQDLEIMQKFLKKKGNVDG